ncbi:MAG: LuxR C-terminal-related transcriptional regulator [Pseudomonadota bacterium]
MQKSPAKTVPTDELVDHCIARLYRSVVSVPPDKFRLWALESLKSVIPFDSAIWGSGKWEERRFHALTLSNLPEHFAQVLEASADENPLISKLIHSEPDTPTTMESVFPDAQFYKSNLYLKTFGPHRVERLMSTLHVDRRSGLYSLVSLYRADRNAPFSAAEQAVQRRLTYHLFNALSHSFFIHLVRTHRDRPAGASTAIVDLRGAYHEAQPRFLDAMDAHWPSHAANQLPFAVPEPGETRVIDGLCVKSEPMGELMMVHCWPVGPLDRLTAREREIVVAVAHGLSFKQAARKIGVAPSTVANHLYRIYRKLGVNSRTALADLIHAVPSPD